MYLPWGGRNQRERGGGWVELDGRNNNRDRGDVQRVIMSPSIHVREKKDRAYERKERR